MANPNKALYVIHRNVNNKYPYISRRQSWAITFALYKKAIRKKNLIE